MWLEIAAAKGSKPARDGIKELEAVLQPDQIERARASARLRLRKGDRQ
jgi:hypothetical protein